MSTNKQTAYHSLADVTLSVGPCAGEGAVDLSGYGEDGGIEYEIQGDLHSYTVGADGHVALEENNNEVVVATLTVMQTTVTYKRLAALARAQKDARGVPPCPFLMRNPHTGDAVNEDQAAFQTFPAPNQQQSVQEYSFDLILPHARPDIVHGANI